MKLPPTPWIIDEVDQCVYDANDNVVIARTCALSDSMTNNESDECTRHIVECVNACKGINPAAVPAMLEALKQLTDELYDADEHKNAETGENYLSYDLAVQAMKKTKGQS